MSAQFFNFFKNCLPWGGVALLTSNLLYGDQSVSHYGITWEFSADRPTGSFANGEPWVVGPVVITNIVKPSIPAGSNPVGGAMINPVPNRPQGYCPSFSAPHERSHYDPSLDVSLKYPFDLVPGDSLISAIALNNGENGGNNYVDRVCVLTVLATSPPDGSFRPGPYGKDRTIRFNKSAINWSVLKNLSPVPSTPTQSWIEAQLPALPWFEWDDQWVGGFIFPLSNAAAGDGKLFRSNYGREIAAKWSTVALWLNVNHTQVRKEKTMIQTIQCGIDIASFIKNGGGFPADGGHKVGRKFPLFLAAVALKDPDLLELASIPHLFQEDQVTFIVQQSDVGRIVDNPAGTYLQEDVGKGEYGVKHSYAPNHDDRRWRDGVPYRFANWPSMTGAVFAAELMGLQGAWGHPAIFKYNERFVATEPLADSFAGQMWDAHKLGRPSAPSGLKIKR